MNKKDERIDKALDILYDYKGGNPYIHMVKRDIYVYKKQDSLTDFKIDFILANKDVEPIAINKVTKIPDWYGENRQEAWGLDFVPKKLKIVAYMGEADGYYCCYVKYCQSVDPVMCFLPKNAVINNFFVGDYHNVKVDFNRYDNLSTAIDETRRLHEHQKEAVQFLLDRKKCILADTMGLGKTTELAVASVEGNFDSILIVCPAGLKTNWKKELMWYVPEKDITIIDGFTDKTKPELEEFLGYAKGKSGKKRKELLEEAKNCGKWKYNKFVIINYEILDEFYTISRVRKEEAVKELVENNPLLKFIYNRKSCIIIDEAQNLSNSTSTQYKIIKDLFRRGNPHSVYLATGTPVTNNPLNLYNLLTLIENEVTSDHNYYINRYCEAKTFPAKGEKEKWTNKFLVKKGKNGWYDLTEYEKNELKGYIQLHAKMITTADGADNLDELKERISHIYLRRTKEDIGFNVKKYVHEIFYSLTPEQKYEYNKLWDEYEKNQKEKNADKELNKELLEGGIYRKYLSNLMVNNTIALCDKILETEDKVIIACSYDEELYALRDHYKDCCVFYNGKTGSKRKDKVRDEFTHNDNIKVFIGNIIASGVGINLTRCKSMIYNNIDWLAANNKQMEDRIYRIGQTRDVDIYYQFFSNTQYEYMWNIVLRKQMISDALIKKETEK